MQVTGYNLLLDSTFDGRRGQSAILYSRAAQLPLRRAPDEAALRRDFLLARNALVGVEHELSADGEAILRLLDGDMSDLPSFTQDALWSLKAALANASAVEKAYFCAFVGFVAREQFIAKVGLPGHDHDRSDGFAALWSKTVIEKKGGYSALYGLRVVPRQGGSLEDEVTLELPGNGLPPCDFRAGDIAVLYPMVDGDYADPTRQHIFRCTILSITPAQLKVKLRNKHVTPEFLSPSDIWALEHDALDLTFDAMYRSLLGFLEAPQERRELLLGCREPRFADTAIPRPDGLTDMQYNLLRRALSAQDYFLLQGPPGTGKTSRMLRAMVGDLAGRQQERVLVLAFTNRAVDEICEAVHELNVPYVRLGSNTDRFRSALLQEKVRDKTIREVRRIINEQRVFVSTVASYFTSQDILADVHFDTAIVDEASQLLEPHLIGLLTRVKRFILIGDEKQLSAVVAQPKEMTQRIPAVLQDIGIVDLRMSLFERLLRRSQKSESAHGQLVEQGRMHEDIARIPNELFYEEKLRQLHSNQSEPITRFRESSRNEVERLLACRRVIFLNTPPERRSKVNEQEARVVCRLLREIRERYGKEFQADQTVGVITPFRAQIATIRKNLGSDFQDVTVDTVERFQGSEREIIIVSFAVNKSYLLRYLEDVDRDGSVDRKLNVMLTRAKQHLILLGSADILTRSTGEHGQKHNHYQDLLCKISEYGLRVDLASVSENSWQ